MGDWQLRHLRIKLKSPLRCGDRPLGFIARTLPFVPGHIPLMALVPTAVEKMGLSSERKNYKALLAFFSESIRFTSFYIFDKKQNRPLFPFDKSEDLREIQYRYLCSRHGVGIDYSFRSALDAHLFETETINHISRKRNKTCLDGYIMWKKAKSLDFEIDDKGNLKSVRENISVSLVALLNFCRWGGERSKGFGAINVQECDTPQKIWGAEIDLKKDSPRIHWPSNQKAPFFLRWNSRLSNTVFGSIRPVTGRRHDAKKGSGHSVWRHEFIWDLGWTEKQAEPKPFVLETAMLSQS